jgi:hypothetical protein
VNRLGRWLSLLGLVRARPAGSPKTGALNGRGAREGLGGVQPAVPERSPEFEAQTEDPDFHGVRQSLENLDTMPALVGKARVGFLRARVESGYYDRPDVRARIVGTLMEYLRP